MISLIEIHKKRIRRRKHKVKHRQLMMAESVGLEGDMVSGMMDKESRSLTEGRESLHDDELMVNFLATGDSLEDLEMEFLKKEKEFDHFSEEGIADMDIPEHLLEELDYLENITSCDKVENYLMLSEYEQNLIKEIEGPDGVR